MAKHNYSVGPWYVTQAEGAIRIRQESSDAVLATMDDGGHPELELIPFAEQRENAALMAAAPALLAALQNALDNALYSFATEHNIPAEEWKRRSAIIEQAKNAISEARLAEQVSA